MTDSNPPDDGDQQDVDNVLNVIAGAEDKPLIISDIDIPAYVLEDETRVLSERGFLSAIGRAERPPSRQRNDGDKLPQFLSANNLKPFISPDLAAATNRIKFQPPRGGPIAYGYNARVLPEVCNVYLEARRAGVLRANQEHIAERAEILIQALATVGIVALIDEATGYQEIRNQRSLALILEQYIAKRYRPWTRTFPYEFYEQIFRLRGWEDPGTGGRPAVIGHYTNDIVYDRLAPGVLEELQRLNPTLPQGGRKQRHHQWFTTEYGHPELVRHLDQAIGIMKASTTWDGFKRSLDRAFPKINSMLPLPLDDGTED
ncbi:MAG: P63C domain-containing protein [Chloroflexota bacterium]|nr:P63C domain-containing protein [Chloroflexota bacterium]